MPINKRMNLTLRRGSVPWLKHNFKRASSYGETLWLTLEIQYFIKENKLKRGLFRTICLNPIFPEMQKSQPQGLNNNYILNYNPVSNVMNSGRVIIANSHILFSCKISPAQIYEDQNLDWNYFHIGF